MKAPIEQKNYGIDGRSRWIPPDKEWLESQLEGKSINLVADELGASWRTVDDWVYKLGVEFDRSRIGERNTSWKGGRSRVTGKRALIRAGFPKTCSWCGSEDEVELHHKDHDPRNNDLNNIRWLCHTCNLLEAYLQQVRSKGKAIVEAEGDTITIRFPHLSET